MRIIITISFLLLLFTSQVGYYIIYHVIQYQIREAVKEQLLATVPASALEMVVAEENDAAIVWQEEGKEFTLNGQLYDVASIRKVKGRTLIYCLNDKKEEKLLQDVSKAANPGDNEKGNRQTLKFEFPHFIADITERVTPARRIPSQQYIDFTAAICAHVKEVLIPPPRS